MIELSETRKIGDKEIVAVISFNSEDFSEQEPTDKPDLLMQAYVRIHDALDEAEVDEQLKTIQNIKIK